MKVLFLRVESIQKRLAESKAAYAVVKTDIEKPVSSRSMQLWKGRGLVPEEKGIAYVKFEDGDKVYEYPLFFNVPENKQG